LKFSRLRGFFRERGAGYLLDNTGIEKIFEMILAFNKERKYERLLNIILTKMMEMTCSDAGTLYIREDGELHFRILKNNTLNIFKSAEETIDLPPVPLNGNSIENVSAYAAINNEIIVIDDVYESNRFNFSGPKNYDRLTGYRTRSMLVLPLTAYRDDKPEVLGVMQLLNATDTKTGNPASYGNVFNPPVLPALANIAANTLSNLIHLEEIRMLFHSFASAMARTIDERSSYNSNHTLKVAKLCESFAKYLNGRFTEGHLYFDDKRLEELTMSAILHDIGKVTAPVSVMDKADRLGNKLSEVRYRFEIKKLQTENDFHKGLISKDEFEKNKKILADAKELVEAAIIPAPVSDEKISEIQKLSVLKYRNSAGEEVPLLELEDIESLSVRFGTLTDGERKIMQEHAAITGRILDNSAFSKYYANVYEWSRSHHEFLDGTGYPRGIKGEDVPTEVCILTIMDIYEALTAADRPYKKAMPEEKAFEILADMAEKGKLDKELVALFKESCVWRDLDDGIATISIV